MDRRSFVRTCVGAAAGGALAAGGLGVASGLVSPRPPPGPLLRYYGAHRVAGPAPRGVPYIPITVQNGVFVGKPLIRGPEGEEINVLDWYKYCGHAGAPGLQQDFTNDNALTYFEKEDYKRIRPWFGDRYGAPVRPDDFPGEGFGAAFSWRSKGQAGVDVLTGVVVKVPEREIRRVASAVSPAKPLASEAEYRWLRENVFHENYIAISTFCTHFCCVPGYREDEAAARAKGAWGRLYCNCHHSVYDFRAPVAYAFSPETPR